MATKTKARGAPGATLMELPVQWSNVNIGDETCRLGAKVDRTSLTVAAADRNLCGKRLIATIVAAAGNSNPEQSSLPGVDADTELVGVFDVKSFAVSRKRIAFGLTFALASVDVKELAGFAKRSGKLIIDRVEDIPKDEAGADDPE